jgi:hypothetical protein
MIIHLAILIAIVSAAHKLKIHNPPELTKMFSGGHIDLHASAIGFTPK